MDGGVKMLIGGVRGGAAAPSSRWLSSIDGEVNLSLKEHEAGRTIRYWHVAPAKGSLSSAAAIRCVHAAASDGPFPRKYPRVDILVAFKTAWGPWNWVSPPSHLTWEVTAVRKGSTRNCRVGTPALLKLVTTLSTANTTDSQTWCSA